MSWWGSHEVKYFFLPGGPGEDHNSSFMVPFLVFQVFRGSLLKPSANHHGIPANKIDLGSFQGWSTLSSYPYVYNIYIYIFFFFFHSWTWEPQRSTKPGGHSKNRGASPEVLYQSWIQIRIKQKRVMGEERTQRIRVAAMEEGANLVNVGPQKTSWPTLEIDRIEGIRFFPDFPVIFSVFVGTCDKLVNTRDWLR